MTDQTFQELADAADKLSSIAARILNENRRFVQSPPTLEYNSTITTRKIKGSLLINSFRSLAHMNVILDEPFINLLKRYNEYRFNVANLGRFSQTILHQFEAFVTAETYNVNSIPSKHLPAFVEIAGFLVMQDLLKALTERTMNEVFRM